MKKTTRHEAGNDGRQARILAVCALWLAVGTAQAQILISAEDTMHRVHENPDPLGHITNVRIVPGDDKQATIQFDAAWQGSWRNDINHAAAWIFFKVRPEGAKEWQHIRLAADRVLNPKGYSNEGNRKMDFLLPQEKDLSRLVRNTCWPPARAAGSARRATCLRRSGFGRQARRRSSSSARS